MTMKIYCTVEEFADLVRGCQASEESGNCPKCALYRVCREGDRDVSQFVSFYSILPELEKEE
jgi:hypothetical protein